MIDLPVLAIERRKCSPTFFKPIVFQHLSNALKPSMKKIFFVLCCLPIMLSAQINESDTLKLKATLSLSGIIQTGNVETFIFRAKSGLSVRPWRKWVLTTQNSYIYQAFGREKADVGVLSLNFLYFNPDQRIYPFVLGIMSSSFRREIDLRYLMGAGFTVNVLNHERNWLKFSLSSEYEQTDFTRADFNEEVYNVSPSIHTFRATLWAKGKYHLFKNKIVFAHESYFQPSLRRSNNYRWQADLSLSLPIWKFLDFKINYIYTFESIVIVDQKREDQFLTFGFTLKSF